MFFSKKLQKFENIKHCFFSRKNGTSQGIYESLNCGLGSSDNKDNVLKNLEIVSKKIGCKKESLITLNQKHSNKVIYFENKTNVKNKLLGDAIISKVKNIGISILAADCAPILFYDPKKKIIACAHSGWKGALNGISTDSVQTMGINDCPDVCTNQFYSVFVRWNQTSLCRHPDKSLRSYEVEFYLQFEQ